MSDGVGKTFKDVKAGALGALRGRAVHGWPTHRVAAHSLARWCPALLCAVVVLKLALGAGQEPWFSAKPRWRGVLWSWRARAFMHACGAVVPALLPAVLLSAVQTPQLAAFAPVADTPRLTHGRCPRVNRDHHPAPRPHGGAAQAQGKADTAAALKDALAALTKTVSASEAKTAKAIEEATNEEDIHRMIGMFNVGKFNFETQAVSADAHPPHVRVRACVLHTWR